MFGTTGTFMQYPQVPQTNMDQRQMMAFMQQPAVYGACGQNIPMTAAQQQMMAQQCQQQMQQTTGYRPAGMLNNSVQKAFNLGSTPNGLNKKIQDSYITKMVNERGHKWIQNMKQNEADRLPETILRDIANGSISENDLQYLFDPTVVGIIDSFCDRRIKCLNYMVSCMEAYRSTIAATPQGQAINIATSTYYENFKGCLNLYIDYKNTIMTLSQVFDESIWYNFVQNASSHRGLIFVNRLI
jgi:hypothetical protein